MSVEQGIDGPKLNLLLQSALKLSDIVSLLPTYLKVATKTLQSTKEMSLKGRKGHAVAYTIGSIFKHIINCVQLYFTKGFTNIVL